MLRVADFAPSDVGLKTRAMVAEAVGASVWPEISSPGVANLNWPSPLIEIVPMVRAAVPWLVTITVCGPLSSLMNTSPKGTEVGSTEILGTPFPVPHKATLTVLSSPSLERMRRIADLLPAESGPKVRL